MVIDCSSTDWIDRTILAQMKNIEKQHPWPFDYHENAIKNVLPMVTNVTVPSWQMQCVCVCVRVCARASGPRGCGVVGNVM